MSPVFIWREKTICDTVCIFSLSMGSWHRVPKTLGFLKEESNNGLLLC